MIFGHDVNTSNIISLFSSWFQKMDHVYLNVNEGLIQMSISLSNPEISIGTMADSGTMMWLDEEHRLKFAVVLRWWFFSRMTSKYLTADLEIVIMIELLQWYLTNQVRSGTKQP